MGDASSVVVSPPMVASVPTGLPANAPPPAAPAAKSSAPDGVAAAPPTVPTRASTPPPPAYVPKAPWTVPALPHSALGLSNHERLFTVMMDDATNAGSDFGLGIVIATSKAQHFGAGMRLVAASLVKLPMFAAHGAVVSAERGLAIAEQSIFDAANRSHGFGKAILTACSWIVAVLFFLPRIALVLADRLVAGPIARIGFVIGDFVAGHEEGHSYTMPFSAARQEFTGTVTAVELDNYYKGGNLVVGGHVISNNGLYCDGRPALPGVRPYVYFTGNAPTYNVTVSIPGLTETDASIDDWLNFYELRKDNATAEPPHIMRELADLRANAPAQYAALVARWSSENISNYSRFYSIEDIESLIADRKDDPNDKRPLAVVLANKRDWNGAFQTLGENIMDLRRHGYRVVYREETSRATLIQDLADATRTKKADALLITGHGDNTSILLDETTPDGSITASDDAYFAPVKDALSKGAQIVLEACDTGSAPHPDQANAFARWFPQIEGVHAEFSESALVALNFSRKNKLKGAEYALDSKGKLTDKGYDAKPVTP